MKEIFETVFLLAALQGLLLSLVLFIRKENHSANIILGIATLLLSINLFSNYYYATGLYKQYTWFMGISYPFPFLFGPLFYIYARLISKKDDRFYLKNLLHFVPAALVYLSVSYVFFYTEQEKIAFVEKMIVNEQPLMYTIIETIIPFQGILYTILTVFVVSGYNRRIKDSYSNIDKINLFWLKYITYAMITIWSIVAVVFFVNFLVTTKSGIDLMLHISISILIYTVGYMGLKQPEIFSQPAEVISNNKEWEETGIPEKYQKSGLSDEAAGEIKEKLICAMQKDKHYLDSELTLNKLSGILGVSQHNLSEVINLKLNQTYYDFINNYRVEEFKELLKNPAYKNFNLLSVAYDAGFKSKTTFNTIFKRFTGLTPSEYKNQLKT